MNRSTRAAAMLAVVLLAGTATACGDDATASNTDPTIVTDEGSTDAGHDMSDMSDGSDRSDMPDVVIEGVNYEFHDVPASVPPGTRLGFRNAATDEVHEMVVFKLPDDVDTPLSELLQLPEEEMGPMFGEPVTVILQAPGAEPITAVGDGILTEPGRYALMCFIPIGADPAEFMAAVEAAHGGPPEGVAGGPPHFTGGMHAELVVEDA